MDPEKSESLPLLIFPDEADLAAERRRREQLAREQTEQMLEKMSLGLLDRWAELQGEMGGAAPPAVTPPPTAGSEHAPDSAAPAPTATSASGPEAAYLDPAATLAAPPEQGRELDVAPALPPRVEPTSAIVNTLPDAIVSFGHDGCILTVNAGTERMFGYLSCDLIGRPIDTLLTDDEGGRGADELLAFVRDGVAGRQMRELHGRRQDGSELILEASVGVMTIGAERYGAAVLRDISARRHAERQRDRLTESLHAQVAETQAALEALRSTQDRLVQSEKMASLAVLVAGVAHEINTPLGIAVTATSHLVERMNVLSEAVNGGTLKRSQLLDTVGTSRQAAEMVLSNLTRASELMQSFKQVAVDQGSRECREIDLDVYLHEVLNSLQPRLKKTRHQVDLLCPPALHLYTAPGALAQVITNLVLNSLMHAFGEHDAGQIRLIVTSGGMGVRLRYSDDGVGIEPEVLPKIFDPFFTTKRGAGGSGLGLHIVYNLVTQTLGGRISVSSQPGQGVRFEIELPVMLKNAPVS